MQYLLETKTLELRFVDSQSENMLLETY